MISIFLSHFYSCIFSKLLERLLVEEANGYHLMCDYTDGHAIFAMARNSPNHKQILELLLDIGVYKGDVVSISLYLLSHLYCNLQENVEHADDKEDIAEYRSGIGMHIMELQTWSVFRKVQ